MIAPKPVKTLPTSTTGSANKKAPTKVMVRNNQSRSSFQGNSSFNSNQPSLKDLVLGQAKINENFTKKMLSNDKILENVNTKLENLTSSVHNQLSFNKMLETQIA